MKRIAWKANLLQGWFRIFSFTGEIEVPKDFKDNVTTQAVQRAAIRALKIEWKEIH